MKGPAKGSSWWKAPASWLAVIATAVSATTLYLVQVHPGRLMVVLPDEAGLSLTKESQLKLFVPITFTNTGAARRVRHVRRVTAAVVLDPGGDESRHDFRWRFERQFVGALKYLADHPKEKDVGHVDYLTYTGRAFPFPVRGGESETRILELRPEEDRRGAPFAGKRFLLQVAVYMEDREDVVEAEYLCDPEPSPPDPDPADPERRERIEWCKRQMDEPSSST